jgi:hypothetical protein
MNKNRELFSFSNLKIDGVPTSANSIGIGQKDIDIDFSKVFPFKNLEITNETFVFRGQQTVEFQTHKPE